MTGRRRWHGLVAAALAAWSCSSAATPDRAGVGLLRFDRTVLLERTAETSANVSIGDLNGDGHLDIVLVKGRHWPLDDVVLVGNGSGSFQPGRTLGSAADRSYSGDLVDLDLDGDLDVVISNDYPDPKIVYLNDGKANFSVGSTFGRPEWPTRHVNLADLNGDRLPDIIVANRSEGDAYNYVCFNRGGGRFDADCVGFSRESATTITPADFNRDGRIDLGVPHRDGGQSYIYLNAGAGTFTERIAFGTADAAIRQAEAADLNRDGILDLVVIDERTGAALHLGQRDGSFAAARALGDSAVTPYALATADLNDDDVIDVIVGYVNARRVAFFGDGQGGFTAVEFGDNQGVAYGFAVGDIDEDGFMDIAMARSDAPNVLYFGAPAAQTAR